MFSIHKPVQGSLLLSEPFMLDPTFERSVVLLCEHNHEGSLGFIVNNRTHLILSDLLESVSNGNFPVYLGGPVDSATLFYIHRAYDKLQSGTHITQDIYWGGDFDHLMTLIEENLIHQDEIKFFLGYSGWTKNQLNDELQQNSWAVHTDFDSSLVFINDGENLWKQALISLGPKYAHVARFPKSPDLN